MQAGERGIPVAQAAQALGLSPNAVRKRIRRGSLSAYKVDGQWFIVLPVAHEAAQVVGHQSDLGRDVGRGEVAAMAMLVQQVQEENRRLWELVERVTGERRLPDLPAAPPAPSEPASPTGDTPPQTPTTPPVRRGWLARLLGR